jgi:hypothetical protein
MLPADDLKLAIDIQSRSYRLLRWVADAVGKGFIPPERAHEYADDSDSTYDWMNQHYLNFPANARPDRRYLRQFASFFSTYVLSSFDVIEQPGVRLHSPCGCYCPWCVHMVNASHLQPKKLSKRDKTRAVALMVDRVTILAKEEGVALKPEDAENLVENDANRRFAGYSAYGHWLIKRMAGLSDGKSILALWRVIAWSPTGSPLPKFKLEFKDFVHAEESLVKAMRTASAKDEA